MTTPRQPVFQVGERVYVRGYHRNYKPMIVSIETHRVTVCTPELPGSNRVFKLSEIEKISTTKRNGK